MSPTPRGRLLLAAVVVCSLAFSGCLTIDPAVDTETADSAVFEELSTTEPWSTSAVRVNATLRSTPAAANVTTITVILPNGRAYETTSVEPGQSTVILTLPANTEVTLVASNSANSTTIGTLNVTASGNRVL
jgi:hypothetical protein